MNELLLRHGCCKIFSLPPGLKELMSDISREVLREQPTDIYNFITNYLSALLVTREHGVLAVKILDDLCDCTPSLVDHFHQLGFEFVKSEKMANVVQSNIEAFEPTIGNERFVEAEILRTVLKQFKEIPGDEQIAKLLQIVRNAYKDYWYRKNLMSKHILRTAPQESWEKAVEYTLNVYKKTKPTLAQLHQASLKIQTAYRGYYIRRDMTKRPQSEDGHKVDTRIPDIADSRELELGPHLKMKPNEDASKAMMEAHRQNMKYEPLNSIDYSPDKPDPEANIMKVRSEESTSSTRSSVLDEVEERDTKTVGFPEDYDDSHKKISFGVEQKITHKENKAPPEETITIGEADDVVKVVPTGTLEQGAEAIPEQIREQEEIPEDITVKPDQEVENIHEIPEEIAGEVHGAGTDEAAKDIPEHITEAISQPVAENLHEGAQDAALDDSLIQNDPTVEIGQKQPLDQARLDNDPTMDYAELKPMEVLNLSPDMEANTLGHP